MTIAEFEEKYYLHDSSLDKFYYDAAGKKLTLTISFCFWMQEWYDKSEPTNGRIAVTFANVSQVEYEQHDISKKFDALETEIRTTKIDETGALEIFMWEFLPEINDDIYPSLFAARCDIIPKIFQKGSAKVEIFQQTGGGSFRLDANFFYGVRSGKSCR